MTALIDSAGDVEAARRFLESIKHLGNVIEIRGLGARQPWGTMSGLFDDAMAAAKSASLMSSRGANVYYGLNIVDTQSDYCANTRLNGMFSKVFNTVTDRHIAHRTNLLVDCDPVRHPDWKQYCATDEEKHHAFLLLGRAKETMAALFPGLRPIVNDSGSGYQLIYRCNMPPNEESNILVSNLLHYLGDMLDTAGAEIDRSVFNAGRIARLPGFLNRRGPDLPDRPQRLAQVLEYPYTGPHTVLQYREWYIRTDDLRARGFGGADPDPVAIAKFKRPAWWPDPVAPGIAAPAPVMVRSMDRNPGPQSSSPGPVELPWPVPNRAIGRPAKQSGQRPFIGTPDEVRRYIADYPEHLELARVSRDGDCMYFALGRCPFKGEPHRDMDVGHGKVTIQLRPEGLGFKCFSDDHAHLKFYDLHQWLFEATGRRSQAKLWGEVPLTGLDGGWGLGIDLL